MLLLLLVLLLLSSCPMTVALLHEPLQLRRLLHLPLQQLWCIPVGSWLCGVAQLQYTAAGSAQHGSTMCSCAAAAAQPLGSARAARCAMLCCAEGAPPASAPPHGLLLLAPGGFYSCAAAAVRLRPSSSRFPSRTPTQHTKEPHAGGGGPEAYHGGNRVTGCCIILRLWCFHRRNTMRHTPTQLPRGRGLPP